MSESRLTKMLFLYLDYAKNQMLNGLRCTIDSWMHLASTLSTQEARVALGDTYPSFVLCNLLRASII